MKYLKTFEARDRDSIGKYKETFGYPFNLSMNEMSDIRDILLDIMDMGFEIKVGPGQHDINIAINYHSLGGPYIFTIEKLDDQLDIWGNKIRRIFNISDMIEPLLHLEDYLNKMGLNIMIPDRVKYRRGRNEQSYRPLSEFIEDGIKAFSKLQFKIVKLNRN